MNPRCAVTKVLEDDTMACSTAHVLRASMVSGGIVSSGAVRSVAVSGSDVVAVVEAPLGPRAPSTMLPQHGVCLANEVGDREGGRRPFSFLKFHKGKRDGY